MAGDTYNYFTVNGNDNSFSDVGQSNHASAQPALPQAQAGTVITSHKAWRLKQDYLRRENELDKVKEKLSSNEPVILQIRGIGGFGKTSFCCHLFWDYHKALEGGNAPNGIRHLGWISYDGDLKRSIREQIESEEVTADDPEVRYQQAKAFHE